MSWSYSSLDFCGVWDNVACLKSYKSFETKSFNLRADLALLPDRVKDRSSIMVLI